MGKRLARAGRRLHIHDCNPKAWGRFLGGRASGVKDAWSG
jgi:hypothetical protein